MNKENTTDDLIVDVKTLNDRTMHGFDYGNDGTGNNNDALAVVKEVCWKFRKKYPKIFSLHMMEE